MRTVEVHAVSIPAMSTIGRIQGMDLDTGEEIIFAADHRPARHIGEALCEALNSEPLVVQVEDWQFLGVVGVSA